MIKCVVFDCDGVLLDSVPVKTRAFARLAEPYGEDAMARFVAYHTEHGGVSRFKKFEWFFQTVLGKEISKEESAAWGDRFSQYSFEEIAKCNFIPGAIEVLHQWHNRLPLYVCSGTPRQELINILEIKKISCHFKGIFGTPPEKSILLGQIVDDVQLDSRNIVMVGDANTDKKAALSAGTAFYGIGQLLKNDGCPWSEDMHGFNNWLEDHTQK